MLEEYAHPILVVDDDSLVLETVTEILEVEGFKTLATTNSLEVEGLLRQHPVDLIITDVNMPNLDGIQLLDVVAGLAGELGRTILVIVLTGTGNEYKALEAVKKGAFHYLSKPFNIDYLSNTVKRAILSLRLP